MKNYCKTMGLMGDDSFLLPRKGGEPRGKSLEVIRILGEIRKGHASKEVKSCRRQCEE